MLATRVGGLPEAIRDGETGLMVEPNNPTESTAAIIRLYEERLETQLRRNIAQQQRFSWEDLARSLERVMEDRRQVI